MEPVPPESIVINGLRFKRMVGHVKFSSGQ
jgi:hypothetical protein